MCDMTLRDHCCVGAERRLRTCDRERGDGIGTSRHPHHPDYILVAVARRDHILAVVAERRGRSLVVNILVDGDGAHIVAAVVRKDHILVAAARRDPHILVVSRDHILAVAAARRDPHSLVVSRDHTPAVSIRGDAHTSCSILSLLVFGSSLAYCCQWQHQYCPSQVLLEQERLPTLPRRGTCLLTTLSWNTSIHFHKGWGKGETMVRPIF